MRKLKDDNEVEELIRHINLTILTMCTKKCLITDLETGQSYRATGETELYKQWEPVSQQQPLLLTDEVK